MTEDEKPKIQLSVNYNGEVLSVKLRITTPLRKLFDAAEQKWGKESGSFRFSFDGNRLLPDASPAEMGLQDGDTIDAFLQQIGGAALF